MSALSSPAVSLSDRATRHWEVDVEVQSPLGPLRWVRKYVSTDETWAYQSLVGGVGESFLPKPFGASPGNVGSLRWWHGLYSFVYPQGWVPGVSTWAVRDVDGAVLEYEACSTGEQACFATPRTTSRWSTAQLYWTGGGAEQGHFVLVRPGDGRYVYAAPWRPPEGPRWRYFLDQAYNLEIYLEEADADAVSRGSGAITKFRKGMESPSLCFNDGPAIATISYSMDLAGTALQSEGLTTSLDELIAHELGHVSFSYHAWMNGLPDYREGDQISKNTAVAWENAVRTGAKRSRHDP